MADRQHRDAITGQYVTDEYAEAHPDTTVSEARIRIEPVELHATYGVTLSGTPSDPAKLTRATGNPNTTVSESPCRECDRLRGVVHTQQVAIDGYREEVERLGAGQPIVRTVGDLTARHIGKRVRIGGGRALRLDGLTHTGRGDVKLDISDAQKSGWLVCERDTPCEVLP